MLREGAMRWPGMIAAGFLLVSAAHAQQPKDWQLCQDRAHTSLGNHIRSCTDIINADRISSRNRAIAYNNRGNALREKGALDRAMADFDAAIRLEPRLADAYVNRGITWYRRGDFDRAIADYDEAIRLDPADAYPFNNRCLALRAKGEFDRAIADYDQAIRL